MVLLLFTFSLSLGPAFSGAGNIRLAVGTQTLHFAEGINILPAMDIAWQTYYTNIQSLHFMNELFR